MADTQHTPRPPEPTPQRGPHETSAAPPFSRLDASDGSPSDAGPSPRADPAPPATGGPDFELLEEIARGGMGAVYRARQLSIGRVVALKMILAGRFASPEEVLRFRSEAQAAGPLDHPHIVPVYEAGEWDGRPYFTMKFIGGGSLASRIDSFASDPKAAARLLATVARAVHHAHQHGVLHRDLKPSNILLDESGRPYVGDFGLAKHFDSDAGLTVSEAVLGTPSYMAPEQAAGGAKRATVAADVYSLGAVLYEMLTGRPPFQADTRLETLRRVQEDEPSSVRSANRRVSRDMETVCLKCLSKDPRRRYGSAEALADDLERWLDGKPVRVRRASVAGRAWRWSRRRPAAAALVAVVAAAALSLGAGGLWHVNQLGRALADARQENARARAVVGFIQDVLELASPERTRGRKLTVEEALGEASALAGTRFATQPLTEAEVRTIIGSVYHELGRFERSQAEHRRAVDLRAPALGDGHPDTATSRHLLGESLLTHRFPMRARPHLEKAVHARSAALGPHHPDALRSLDLLGGTYWSRNDYAPAEELHRKVYEARRRTLPPSHPDVLAVMVSLGRDLDGQEKYAEAEAYYRPALAGLRALGTEDRQTLATMLSYAQTLEALDRPCEAELLLREVVDTQTRVLTRDHAITLRSMQRLGRFLLRCGAPRLDAAELVLREVLDSRRRTLGPRNYETLETMGSLADVSAARGDAAAALATRLEMMELARAVRGAAPPPPAPGPPLPPDASVNLLDAIELPRHVVRGRWRRDGSGLAVEPALFARAAIPVDVAGSFVLEVCFTRVAGDGSVHVVVPAGAGRCMVSLGALHGRRHVLQDVWEKSLTDNPTAVKGGRLTNGDRHVLRVSVQLCGDGVRVEASLDGAPCIVPWEGPQAALLEPSNWSLPAGANLAVGSHYGHVVFHGVGLRVVHGEANRVEFDPASWTDPWPYVDE